MRASLHSWAVRRVPECSVQTLDMSLFCSYNNKIATIWDGMFGPGGLSLDLIDKFVYLSLPRFMRS